MGLLLALGWAHSGLGGVKWEGPKRSQLPNAVLKQCLVAGFSNTVRGLAKESRTCMLLIPVLLRPHAP